MTLLYCDPCFLNHETGPNPENAGRLRPVPDRLQKAGLWDRCGRPNWEPVSRRRLGRVHSLSYVDSLWSLAKSGGGEVEEETVVSPASYDVALLAAGCVCDATLRIVRGEDRRALCLVRPPGHHALFNRAMGFCLLNNVAIAASMATQELNLQRLLIVDWDVHHGNGTQDTFWEDPQVGYLSIHRSPFYPHTGWADETGNGQGRGTTMNLPIEFDAPREEYLSRFRDAIEQFADRIQPQMIFISAGFDAHRLDPIGGLGLETEDYATMTRIVLDAAKTYADGRVVSVLEGGYDPNVLADCIAVHLAEMVAQDSPSCG